MATAAEIRPLLSLSRYAIKSLAADIATIESIPDLGMDAELQELRFRLARLRDCEAYFVWRLGAVPTLFESHVAADGHIEIQQAGAGAK